MTASAVISYFVPICVRQMAPEFCPLDSNLFSDYEFAMRQNLAYTYDLPHDHPDKFLVGTASEVQSITWSARGHIRVRCLASVQYC